MNGVDKIIEDIRREADDANAKVLKDASAQTSAALEAAKKRGDEEVSRIHEAGARRCEDIKARAASASQLKRRQMILKKKQELIEARNQADSLIYGTEKSLRDLGDKVDASEKSEVEAKIADLKKAMEGDDVNAIKQGTEALSATSHKLAEKLYQNQNMGGQAGPGAGQQPGGAQPGSGKPDDDVVDADFTEVKK